MSSLAKGFASGANDYLKKPFDIDELLIRVQALIRQNHQSRKNIISYQAFSFHIDSGELYKNKTYTPLTEYEQRLVKLFFKQRGKTLSKGEILFEFSQGEEASEGALRVRINKLRNIGLPIQTIKGVGYRLEEE
jgi:DNA-binding response OmpR family regulator